MSRHGLIVPGFVFQPAYYLSWCSEWRKPIVAKLAHEDDEHTWRTLLEWDVYRIGSGRRKMMTAILQDLAKPTDGEIVGYLHTLFEHHLRIEDRDLHAALADGIPRTLL